MEKRSFSKEEKLAIIKEASINGVKFTLANSNEKARSFAHLNDLKVKIKLFE